MKQELLEKYAGLIVKTGMNIQKDQLLIINSPIECADFTRLVAQAAYRQGARDVVINWKDELFTKLRFLQAPEAVFGEFPEWQQQFYLSYLQQGAAFLSISAADPELLKAVDPDRVATAQKAAGIALQEYREALMSNKNAWCVVSLPTKAWAQKVFPELEVDLAVEKLWEAIFMVTRVTEADPAAAWEAHKIRLKESMDCLNRYCFKRLHYRNSLGTDLTVELPENHIWLGGAEVTPAGLEFIANIPTEEVFTLPRKDGVNGTVVSSRPLNYHGTLIEDFTLRFENGRIIEYHAAKGQEVLAKLIGTDEGSCYLGEVALVPYDSPISRLGILFFNTLFDENASCHLAIGKAYPVCVKDGENMSAAELEQAGVNDSLVHEDFMIGTADLVITGTTAAGEEIAVFKDGNFAF